MRHLMNRRGFSAERRFAAFLLDEMVLSDTLTKPERSRTGTDLHRVLGCNWVMTRPEEFRGSELLIHQAIDFIWCSRGGVRGPWATGRPEMTIHASGCEPASNGSPMGA